MKLKMDLLINFFSLLFIFLFINCGYVHNKEGVFVAKKFRNTIDTLKLYANGSYEHIIYDKNKSKLININSGSWEYEGSRLVLYDFLVNEDDLRYFNDSVTYDHVLMTRFFNTGILSNTIIIDYDLDKYYYKIEDY